jgi:rSAM/selenodomain-associated transferase 1
VDRETVCILAKAPRPGVVKTRLAPSVGPEGAAALASAFLEDAVALVRGLGWARAVVALDGEPRSLAFPSDVEVWQQGPGDLGDRMERALLRAFDAGGAPMVIGTDSPGLPRRHLEAARAALRSHDAVVGPADDGGFYLLGLRRPWAGLLAGLPWSRPETLLHTEARLRHGGRSVARLERWFDVDEPADLVRLARLLASGEIQAPATSRALARLGILLGMAS